LATDGIWDTMENHEAANFVEKYRYNCMRYHETPEMADIVTSENSNIAQFLCEQARAKWLKIVAEEDVMIDDITAIVLEF
jgi:serine/threonine protein phosphatase PrpC